MWLASEVQPICAMCTPRGLSKVQGHSASTSVSTAYPNPQLPTMASAVKRLLYHARYIAPRVAYGAQPIAPPVSQLPPWRRAFSTSVRQMKDQDDSTEIKPVTKEELQAELPSFEESLDEH